MSKPGVLEIEGRIPPVEPLTVKLSPEECAYVGPAGEEKEESQKKLILEAIGSQHINGKEIGTKTGIPYSTVMKRLKSLRMEGKVSDEKGTGKGSPHLWFRTETIEQVKDSFPGSTKPLVGKETNSSKEVLSFDDLYQIPVDPKTIN